MSEQPEPTPAGEHTPATTSQPTAPGEKARRPCSAYTHAQLADIYNQARVDYIVPMPMNAKRMGEYISHYDIDLDGSFVSLNSESLETGIGMLGVRGDRTWATRLGVLPQRRERHIGLYLMESMIAYARRLEARQMQLEVIVGNEPARRLFEKLGFVATRELMIVRRPPGLPDPQPDYDVLPVEEVPGPQIARLLHTRDDQPSWVEETESMLNAGALRGIRLTLPDGTQPWLIFQRSAFQLSRFAFGPGLDHDARCALLYHVHKQFPMQDTKVENVPAGNPLWDSYAASRYIEVFRRTEMVLQF